MDELDELPTYKAVAVVKTISERCRQTIEGGKTTVSFFCHNQSGAQGNLSNNRNIQETGDCIFYCTGKNGRQHSFASVIY